MRFLSRLLYTSTWFRHDDEESFLHEATISSSSVRIRPTRMLHSRRRGVAVERCELPACGGIQHHPRAASSQQSEDLYLARARNSNNRLRKNVRVGSRDNCRNSGRNGESERNVAAPTKSAFPLARFSAFFFFFFLFQSEDPHRHASSSGSSLFSRGSRNKKNCRKRKSRPLGIIPRAGIKASRLEPKAVIPSLMERRRRASQRKTRDSEVPRHRKRRERRRRSS